MTAFDLCETISKLSGDNVLIAIDGRAAAGKTTLAEKIAEHLDCNIIHCDHFFLPPEMRTAERLSEPGGNIHYERLKKEVTDKHEEVIEYGIFSCRDMKITEHLTLPKKRITIVEGSYSTHPKLDALYDLTVFVNVSPEIQKERIIKRNGTEKAKDFFAKWIPMEEKYIEHYNIDKKCNIFLDFSIPV